MAHATSFTNRSARRQRGITLIEGCIVVVVSTIIAFSVAPSFQKLIDTRRLIGAADQLASDIYHVRSAAVARNQPLRVSFRATPSFTCYVIHTGAASACECSLAGPATCSPDVLALKTVAIAGERISVRANVGSIVFDPVHGTSTPAATLRVVDSLGPAIHHVVNIMGRVRSCTPLGVVSGYRAC